MKRIMTARRTFAFLATVCVSSVVTAATPTAEEVAKLVATDLAAWDAFGWSVALDGNTAVIGAPGSPGDNGAAYVFTRNSGGTWTQQAELVAGDGAVFDEFGWSVAVDGDTAVIGARRDDDNGTDSGSAYVFTRDSSGNWAQQAKIVGSDSAQFDVFGGSVAVDGDTVVIGAELDDDKGSNSGSAYVFTRDGDGNWTQQAKLVAGDGDASDQFGNAVAVDGDTVVIGAFSDDDNGSNSGSAYVFTLDGAGGWSEQAKIKAGDGTQNDNFGWSVAIEGDTAVIGARNDDQKGVSSGSAYVFARVGVVWSQQAKLLASDGRAGDNFGFSVAVDGDMAAISARLDDDRGSGSGSVYVFTRGGGGWTETLKLLASDGRARDYLGYWSGAVDVAGSTVLAGAPAHDLVDPDRTDAGAAYVFSVGTSADAEGPITSNVSASPNPVAVGFPVVITAIVDDTTTGDSNIASAAYAIAGEGTASMSASDGSFDSSAENVVATIGGLDVGVYEICVSGTDAAGNTGAAECSMLPVYDPTAGFVTGGGWIQSPEGAYLPDPSLSGKANFGFVSRYKKGANVPDGNTQFVFHAGGLNFHSSSYEWLVVAGGKAQFKGVGTINGAGNYGFMIFAKDAGATSDPADVDSFRIQIWDRDNADASVYDNGVEQALGGGSIVVHTGGKK